MMTSPPFAPIIVENQVIKWKVVSGIAVGVHKYTKTHVSGGELNFSTVEIIVECSIQQDYGEEIPVKLSTWEKTIRKMNGKEGFEEIRLREGQLISVIRGYTDIESSNWLIFINHDDKKWYWLNSYSKYSGSMQAMVDIPQTGKFLNDLGVSSSLRVFYLFGFSILLFFIVLLFMFIIFILPSSFFSLGILLFWMTCIGVGIGLILLFKIWEEKINPSRQILKLQIAEMARSLI